MTLLDSLPNDSGTATTFRRWRDVYGSGGLILSFKKRLRTFVKVSMNAATGD